MMTPEAAQTAINAALERAAAERNREEATASYQPCWAAYPASRGAGTMSPAEIEAALLTVARLGQGQQCDAESKALRARIVAAVAELESARKYSEATLAVRARDAALARAVTLEGALREAVNRHCSCGGSEPGRGCTACEVWHEVISAAYPLAGGR